MKKILLTLIAFTPFLASSQIKKVEPSKESLNFTVSGSVKNLKDGNKVYLVYQIQEKPTLDSVNVVNGEYSFKGQIGNPTPAALFLNSNPILNKPDEKTDALSFYLEPANIKIWATDSLKQSSISGSKTNSEDALLKNSLAPLFKNIASLQSDFAKLSDAEKEDSKINTGIKAKYDTYLNEVSKTMETFIRQNSNSYISLLLCAQMANDENALPKAKELLATLSPEIKKMDLAVKMDRYFKQAEAAPKKPQDMVGQMAIDFTQNDVNGKPVKLSDFKGKYVLLDFWASWCGPCRQENPNIVSAYKKFKDKGFTVLGVSLDRPDGKENWLKAIETDQLNWTQVSDLKYWKNDAAVTYGINSIPASFLIDPSGKIIGSNLRGVELHQKLEEIFSK